LRTAHTEHIGILIQLVDLFLLHMVKPGIAFSQHLKLET